MVGRKLRVFSPLHKTWCEGNVKSFDKRTGMHLIQYEGAEVEEVEFLDLEKEKLEWIEEEAPRKRGRLKRLSSSQVPKMEVEKGSGEFDSTEEKEEEELVAKRSRNLRSGKRKKVDAEKLGCSKKFRVDGDSDRPKGCSSVTPMSKSRSCAGLTSQSK